MHFAICRPRRLSISLLEFYQARFRVYGLVTPVFPPDISVIFDLAHVFAGGRVVYTSDQHFGVGSNLILPGRGKCVASIQYSAVLAIAVIPILTFGAVHISGKDMGDGWETKRSRAPGHKDWAIIRL